MHAVDHVVFRISCTDTEVPLTKFSYPKQTIFSRERIQEQGTFQDEIAFGPAAANTRVHQGPKAPLQLVQQTQRHYL